MALCGCAPSAVATLHEQPRAAVQPSAPAQLARHTGAPAHAVEAVDERAAELDGEFGVAVIDRVTGEFARGANAELPMYSASLVKIIAAVELVERGPLTPQDRSLLQRALGPSDDEAMNALWDRHGGESLITGAVARMHLQQTRPPDETGRWGQTTTSARDLAAVFDHLLSQVSVADREFLLSALHAAPEEGADGVDQDFGLMAVDAHAVKSGWMCCQKGKVWLHSAGVVDPEHRRYVVALLSAQPSSAGYGGAGEELTEAARTALTPLR
ncbi:serine hydrolase [Saccharopolyspora rhizosphaerae]|uniref:serine hydrolase n=1 Tax=Saccharopolyspora rhizosphaerae TaxID=2492662 RepID=UPI001F210885|nr:serine hydrolase [Saccharopolyspora rhizosphaerae]